MGRNGEKKTVRQRFLEWGHRRSVFILEWLLPVLAVIFIVGAAWCLYLAGHRDYERIAFVLMPTAGGILTIWVAQGRFIEQQEREDKRQNERLESEAKMHDERLKSESQKDRAQRSITQRIDLAEKLASAIEHLSSENELKQAAGVQEILFQIDDWYALIESEIAGMGGDKAKKDALEQEGLRHRQELFDIAYKFDTKNIYMLKLRAKGLRQRLKAAGANSFTGLNFSEIMISEPQEGFSLDLKGIVACDFDMSNAKMRGVDLEGALLNGVNLRNSDLQKSRMEYVQMMGADLSHAKLNGVSLFGAYLAFSELRKAHFDEDTVLDEANLRFANLSEASFGKGAKEELGSVYSYHSGAHMVKADLRFADLSEAHLEGVNLYGTNLAHAYLYDAHLQEARLCKAHLEYSDLCAANLKSVELREACLDCTDLTNANLCNADLAHASLKSADMSNAVTLQYVKSLSKAKYNKETKFPFLAKGRKKIDFNPVEHKMILDDQSGPES